MSIEITNVQRMRLRVEPTFATDATATLAQYTDVPFIEGSLSVTLIEEMLNPEYAQQHLDGYPVQLVGKRACAVSFSLNLAPTGTAGASGVAQVEGALGTLLKTVMGAQNLATGDDVQASPSPTTTGFTVANAAANNLLAGCAIGVGTGASGAIEAREIESVATNALTLKMALSGAPSSGEDVRAFASYWLDQNPSTTLQFIVEGAEQDDRWLLLGCQLESMSLEMSLDQLPRITFQMRGVRWIHGGDTATSLIGAAIAAATYTAVAPTRVAGEVLWQTVGTSTRPDPLAISSLSIEPALGYVPVPSPSGTNGVSSWRRNRVAPVAKGSLTVPFGAETEYVDVRAAKTLKCLFAQWGTTAGGIVLVSLPTVQIVDVQMADAGGIRSQKVDFVAQLDGDTASGTTDRERSAWRIHLG